SYFYFMGHGGIRDGHPIFCPTDYNGKVSSAIKLEELEANFDMIQGTKILLLESCHSGNFIEKDFNAKIINAFQTKAFNKDSYQVITSCKGTQYSWYHGNMSYFTMGVYQGCLNLKADYNANEIVDLSELYIYTIDWVDNHTTKNQDAQMYPDGSTFPIIEY
ncbi:MAG: hypothetical protein KAW56_16740, partial [Candidatus Marinimicrobia bacterium]|nr:hypothetical protein [Candidatus Neomarinimicrobiota bacterium]